MEKRFAYAETTRNIILALILLGIGCLLCALFKRDDIEFGNIVVLVFPVSTYVLTVLGLTFIIVPLFFYARSVSKSDHFININKDSFTYPDYAGIKSVTKEIIFEDVDLLWIRKINGKNESLVIYTPMDKGFQRFDCRSNYFGNKVDYIEFKKIILDNCKNIQE